MYEYVSFNGVMRIRKEVLGERQVTEEEAECKGFITCSHIAGQTLTSYHP